MLMAPAQHPLESICNANPPNPPEEPGLADHTDSEGEDQLCGIEKGDHPLPDAGSMPGTLSLSGIKFPALLIDDGLSVAWQNKMAADQLWRSSRFAKNDDSTLGLFDILFNPQFQQMVENWRQWAGFFVRQAMAIIPEEALLQRINKMVHSQKELILSLIAQSRQESTNGAAASSHLVQVLPGGEIRKFDVMAMGFGEGRLFIFEPAARDEDSTPLICSYEIRQRFENVRRHPNPIKMSHGVLSASVDNSKALQTGLLSQAYCRLVHDLCQRCIHTIEKFGGIFCKHSDSGFLAHFIAADEYEKACSMRTIECALALKSQMADLDRQWKLQKAWLLEIRLNIGIHFENEFMGILSSSVGDSLVSYGGASNLATDLSRLGREGQIWATKSLINDLPPHLLNKLRFGIHRPDSRHHQVFVKSCFSHIREMHGIDTPSADLGDSLETAAVTQVFDLEGTSTI